MRLNPFVYISETDIRFYVLVIIGIIMPSFWALTFGILISSIMGELEITIFLRLLIMVLIFSFIPFLIYWNYKRFPKKIMEKSKLKEFDQKKFPDHCEYIEKLHGMYLPTVKQPTLMYQPFDLSESGFTFGTKNHRYIGITGGLIRKFRKNINGFKSIILHEMGHIANRDIEKTYLVVSTWRFLFITLSIPFGIYFLYSIYLILGVFYYGILAGYDTDNIISMMGGNLGIGLLMYGVITLYFLIFLTIVYVLRNQIIRLREFYADAKVIEWEESPKEIVKTLEEGAGEQYSKFEILTKFHPDINERIRVLKNNLSLFTPGLWVAFSIGFFYSLIELSLIFLETLFSISSWEWAAMGSGEYQPNVEPNIAFRAFILLFIFTILMIAVSSSFHKSTLKAIFIDNTRYFSTDTILNIIKFSLVFSLGWVTYIIILLLTSIPHYEINILIGDLFDIGRAWIFHAIYFSIALVFLLIFASMLIRRSFSKKEAEKNFLMITIFSSILYSINRFVAIEILDNKPMVIAIFLIFSIATYTFIRMKDRKLCCPNCNKKISNLSGLKLNCPNCHHNLYSWAVYSFSNNSAS